MDVPKPKLSLEEAIVLLEERADELNCEPPTQANLKARIFINDAIIMLALLDAQLECLIAPTHNNKNLIGGRNYIRRNRS